MQKEITERTDILDDNGHVIQPGWARDDLWNYDRSKIKDGPLRIKEWDFWEIYNADYRVILNIFDIGLFGLAQFTFTDFKTKKMVNAGILKFLTKGSFGNPKSWRYEKPLRVTKGNNWMEFSFDKNNNTIHLKCEFPNAQKKKGIRGEVELYVDPKMDGIVNLIPFENPKKFVYAEKINCMVPNGKFQIGDREVIFNKENHSWGVIDWTRAVFPHRNQWKWCSASGTVKGVPFGFNIDYGFGTESGKSMIFYNRKGHHLNEVYYELNKDDLNTPVKITSNDNRVNLILTPTYTEKQGVDVLLIAMKGKSAFGYFTGEMVLDDGTKVQITKEDGLYGWAEEYYQKW